ncbi:MAG: GNAT family N-acetyltransferase [Chloroflexota bacterium]
MLTIRDFNNSDADYQACIAIWNANHGTTQPEILQQWKDRDRHLGKTHPISRLVGEIDGQVVCYGQYAEESWAYQPGKYIWDFGINPEVEPCAILPQLYEKIVGLLLGHGAFKILVNARSDETYRVVFIESQGYRQIQREPTSWLDVTQFQPAKFEEVIERINGNGIQIYSVAQLSEMDPNWLRKLHVIVEAARMDVPAEEPPSPLAFEEFASRVNDPNDRATHKTRFVAVDTKTSDEDGLGKYVGVTNLRYNVVDSTLAHTGLTGMARAYRRQGIATALKVHSISQAKADGVRRIDTDNDENNPMLDLNLKLEFQPGPIKLLYEKVIEPS